MAMGANVTYYTNGKGRWLRREWKPQCPSKVFFYGRCQGVKGHKGVHWGYSPCGSLHWADNDDDRQQDGCAGSIPPGHKEYVSPVKMQKHYFMSHYTDKEIADKAVVAMLERDNPPERGASINRPVVLAREAKAIRQLLQKRKAEGKRAPLKFDR